VSEDTVPLCARRLFRAAVCLAVGLVGVKAYHLGIPPVADLDRQEHYVRSLAAISYADVLCVAVLWSAARVALPLAGRWRRALRVVSCGFVGLSALCAWYAALNVLIFDVFGGFLTYPLLALVGDVRMVQSSIGAHMTPAAVGGLVSVPLAYLAIVGAGTRLMRSRHGAWWPGAIAAAALVVWPILGHHTFTSQWRGRPDRRIAANALWVFAASCWQAAQGDGIVRMPDQFPEEDLADFAAGFQAAPPQAVVRRASAPIDERAAPARRPPNVILLVLESVGARWTSLPGGPYDTTPTLVAESKTSLVFDNAYALAGRSSSSLVTILISAYPKLDFREITETFPDLPGTSLAAVFRDHGFHTAFMTSSDLRWAGWGEFLDGRGFADVRDHRDLPCPEILSSWGVEDRCLVDAMVAFLEQTRTSPFFLMAWSIQTHHPYDLSPGVPELDLLRERTPDDWELARYLNIIHGTDRHLARLFDAVRRTALDQDTLIVVTGDHGQAFGYPHEQTYIQGRPVYQEDVNVPLMFWFPRAFQTATRSKTIASHLDLAPTIAETVGLPAAPDWQGRSLFDARLPRRAYFYVAEARLTLGVREANWKYIYDLRDGTEELYDLERDPDEQRNLAAEQPDRSLRLRQRLAAWTEANRLQYQDISQSGSGRAGSGR
jgi:phosphoglycerol transferase MdoB-like AlkP superfamily enzyme